MSGWIKMHRQILNWEWYNDPNTFRVFLHLILKANHKEKRYKGMELSVGSVVTSREILAIETGLSVQKIRTCLERLKTTSEITIKTNTQGTVIQVVKYKDYQIVTNEITEEQPTNNQQITTNNKEKKERSIFIPPTFNEILEYCMQNQLDVDCHKFLNFYHSKGWMVGKNKMKDWKAAIRNWAKPKNEDMIIDPLVEKARQYGYIK
jgi:hypothetical protein